MFERAVICTDLSPSSESIVACAGALGVLGIREVVLAHIIDIGTPGSASVGRDADALFASQAQAIERAGFKVHVDTTVGYPPYAIEQIAEQHNASLIVIGSHGKGLFVSTFSGSVSSDLVRISTRPILLAVLSALGQAEQSTEVCARLLSRVLFPTDFSDASAIAAGHLEVLAPFGLGEVNIVHVVDNTVGNGIEFKRCDAQEQLAKIADKLLDAGAAKVNTEVLIGSPERETARFCAATAPSMVVMAPRCNEDPGQPLGGVTHAVIQTANSPVLLVPPGCRR